MTQYAHLSEKEREEIYILLQSGVKMEEDDKK
jgi:hypothetical protein